MKKTKRRDRGSIRERASGHWEVRVEMGFQDGKRRARYATVKGSRSDAVKALTALQAKIDVGNVPPVTKGTVSEHLDRYLDTRIGIGDKTRERYRELFRYQIAPHLGHLRVSALRPEHVEAWQRTLADQGKKPNTIRNARILLRSGLRRTEAFDRLKDVDTLTTPQKESEHLSNDEARAVLAAIEGTTLYPIVFLGLSTGMRRGELLGLRWGDLNLDARKVDVTGALEETARGVTRKAPKTKAGRRTITIDPDTVAMLRAHKVGQMELRAKIGAGQIKPDTPVFCTVNQEWLSPNGISRAWRRALDTHKLRRVPFYALRHTHASRLIAAGVNIVAVSKRLGHAKVSVTLDVYSHLMPGADEAAAAAMEGALKMTEPRP